jgi:hypothetical protein
MASFQGIEFAAVLCRIRKGMLENVFLILEFSFALRKVKQVPVRKTPYQKEFCTGYTNYFTYYQRQKGSTRAKKLNDFVKTLIFMRNQDVKVQI